MYEGSDECLILRCQLARSTHVRQLAVRQNGSVVKLKFILFFSVLISKRRGVPVVGNSAQREVALISLLVRDLFGIVADEVVLFGIYCECGVLGHVLQREAECGTWLELAENVIPLG